MYLNVLYSCDFLQVNKRSENFASKQLICTVIKVIFRCVSGLDLETHIFVGLNGAIRLQSAKQFALSLPTLWMKIAEKSRDTRRTTLNMNDGIYGEFISLHTWHDTTPAVRLLVCMPPAYPSPEGGFWSGRACWSKSYVESAV